MHNFFYSRRTILKLLIFIMVAQCTCTAYVQIVLWIMISKMWIMISCESVLIGLKNIQDRNHNKMTTYHDFHEIVMLLFISLLFSTIQSIFLHKVSPTQKNQSVSWPSIHVNLVIKNIYLNYWDYFFLVGTNLMLIYWTRNSKIYVIILERIW